MTTGARQSPKQIPVSRAARIVSQLTGTVRIVPISSDIAIEITRLPESFTKDPADRVIVATSRVLGVPVVTYDRVITQSRLVRRWAAEEAKPGR